MTATKPPVTIDKQTNALRVLVVPMGDPSNTKAVQWSSAAQSELQNLLSNAARAYPVQSGTGDLSATATGGIRYAVSGALLDVKSLGLYKSASGKTKFCASGATWSTTQVTTGPFAGHTLKGDLFQRLQDYNRVNNPPADVVMGVVDGAIAWKSTDGQLCDDGRAATPAVGVPSQIGWVRIANYGAGDPANYPSPLAMELLHNFGIVNPNVSLTFHSTSVESDGGTDRAYNALQLKAIATANGALGLNDHSVMNYNTTSIPFTKDNTALEPRDWSDALCDLGGVDSTTGATPFANCTLNAAVGTSAGVAAGNTMYGVSGVIVGGAPRVTDAGIVAGDSTVPIGLASGSSPLQLLACSGACTGTNTQHTFDLAVYSDEGHSDSGVNLAAAGNGFSAVVPVDTAWTGFALTFNGATTPVGDNGTTPQVTSTSGSAPFLLREFDSPVCCNGRAVAFDGKDLYVSVASPDPENSASNTTIYKISTAHGETLSSFGTGGRVIGALAFDPANGHLYAGDYTRPVGFEHGTGKVFDIDLSSVDGPSFSDLFTFSDDTCPSGLGPSIDGLEWLPGDPGKFAIGGDVCTKVFLKDKTGADVLPPFTLSNGKSGITSDGAGGLWIALLNTEAAPDGTDLVHTNLQGVIDQQLPIPGFQAEDLAYDSVTFAPDCAVWANQATLVTPHIRAYQVPCGGAASDTVPPAITFTATNAKYATAYFTCGDPSSFDSEKYPIADGLDPSDTQEQVQTFSFYWSAMNLTCGEGTPKVLISVSDGFTHSPLTDSGAQLTVSPPSKPPFASIAAPIGTYPESGKVHFEGAGWDPEEGDLSGSALKWYEGTNQIGTGKSFDITAAGVGPHPIRLDVTDQQGHTDTALGTYFVMYAGGTCAGDQGRLVLQPMNPDGSSVFKKGSTIPIKFRVCDRSGNSIGTPGVVLPTASPLFKVPQGQGCVDPPSSSLATPVFCANVGTAGAVDEGVVSTASDTSFRWDAANQVWTFNMSTSNLSAGVKRKYYIPLNDGTYIFFTFGLK
jgi:hypothetical protein